VPVELVENLRRYRISGLDVVSEIALPGALTAPGIAAVPDVVVRRAAVPEDLSATVSRGPDWAMEEGRFLLAIPGVARILISGGRDIAFDIDANAEDGEAAIFLLGTAFGILLQQRGHLVLHASAVEVNGQAVLFSGPSGAGKSTLAAALSRDAHSFFADDVCHVAFDAGDRPTVAPDGRMLKLWADALDHLSLAHAKGDAVRARWEKYYVPPPRKTESSALPLAAVYFLREARPSLTLGIERVNVAEAAPLLASNAYRPHLVHAMGLVEPYFLDAAKIWRYTRLFFLTRPRDFGAMPQLVRDLDAHWRALGLLPATGTQGTP
jgi:hypothetical protein